MKLQVIIGSTRQNRIADKPAKWIFEEARKKEGVEVELVDLRDYPLPFFDEPISPVRMNGHYNNEAVARWAKKVAEADGYIIVSPEYNHGYSAVLKNAFDQTFVEWNRKPVGFVGYGNTGGARAVEQLRQVVVELEMAPIRHALHLPVEVYLAIAQGKPDPFEPMKARVDPFLDQLIWWTKALKTARAQDAK